MRCKQHTHCSNSGSGPRMVVPTIRKSFNILPLYFSCMFSTYHALNNITRTHTSLGRMSRSLTSQSSLWKTSPLNYLPLSVQERLYFKSTFIFISLQRDGRSVRPETFPDSQPFRFIFPKHKSTIFLVRNFLPPQIQCGRPSQGCLQILGFSLKNPSHP